MECAPGEEAQVDFGTGAPVIGSRRQAAQDARLSHRAEPQPQGVQRGDVHARRPRTFFRCLENAFRHFGGVPKTLVIDNLKAAVAHPDWFDPELTPKVQSFCRHYGTVILPTKPYMPRHKGKVEAGVKYVKNNALKGRTFASLRSSRTDFLADWERPSPTRGSTARRKQQVGKVFEEVERAALLPLPLERFPFFHEAQRKVNRDGHVEVAKAYYSVPPEYLGRTVWVRWDARLVRIFNHRLEQIAVHVRHEQGRFSTHGRAHRAGEDQRPGTRRGVPA